MNGNHQESQPHHPTSPTPTAKETIIPADQPSSSSSSVSVLYPNNVNQVEIIQPPPPPQQFQPAGGSGGGDDEKWGTHIMGAPAVPTCHPNNQKAALWGAPDYHQQYLHYTPIEKPATTPMESVLHKFNSWSTKAESTANNIWHNLKTGSSVSGAAWAKVNLTAKAITGGGFESLYKQTFATFPDEKLKKTFACYLSTSTGPVAGTLFLSNAHVAFCSDRPLSFTAPSGQHSWSYYKIMVPLAKIGTINPIVIRDNQSERYIQIVTIDGHDFWFMGFVNYEKASRHLTDSISNFVAYGIAVPVPPNQSS
ncbi:GEM-like protein 5 [Cornus florida]|uniref:GEM-like protein 5 n=1 Tax=Cornus florida TaxID=4283 RepID=UPI0028A18A8E|nr:GEM-like protein 5 [Cornus florida]